MLPNHSGSGALHDAAVLIIQPSSPFSPNKSDKVVLGLLSTNIGATVEGAYFDRKLIK